MYLIDLPFHNIDLSPSRLILLRLEHIKMKIVCSIIQFDDDSDIGVQNHRSVDEEETPIRNIIYISSSDGPEHRFLTHTNTHNNPSTHTWARSRHSHRKTNLNRFRKAKKTIKMK